MIWPLAAIGLACIFSWIGEAVRDARVRALRTTRVNRLMQLAGALTTYEDVNGAAPPSAVMDTNGKPVHSWRALVLPYLGTKAESLHRRYDFSTSWNGVRNHALRNSTPMALRLPGESDGHVTNYVLLTFRRPVKMSYHGVHFEEEIMPFVDCDGKQYVILEFRRSQINWLEPRDLAWGDGTRASEFERVRGLVGKEAMFVDYHWTIGQFADLTIRPIDSPRRPVEPGAGEQADAN